MLLGERRKAPGPLRRRDTAGWTSVLCLVKGTQAADAECPLAALRLDVLVQLSS